MYKTVALFVVGSLGLAIYVGINPPSYTPPQKTAAVAAGQAASSEKTPARDQTLAGNGLASITLNRSGDGHFYADAMVNGRPVRFLVDTGATSVALTRADAQAIGLQFSESEFTAKGQSAGGEILMKPITLERVALGAIEANNVSAVIGDAALTQSLLGQSYLSRVASVVIEDNRMELR